MAQEENAAPGTARVSDAALCRVRGWKVGDVLQADPTEKSPMIGVQTARITAIGEDSILVRILTGPRAGLEMRWARQLHSYAISLLGKAST